MMEFFIGTDQFLLLDVPIGIFIVKFEQSVYFLTFFLPDLGKDEITFYD